MQRRQFNQAGVSALGALFLATYQQAHAISLGDLAGISNSDAVGVSQGATTPLAGAQPLAASFSLLGWCNGTAAPRRKSPPSTGCPTRGTDQLS